VRFDLPTRYAAGERIFDSIAILPKHRLAEAYAAGDLSRIWSVDTDPREITGLGPFRLKQYAAGQRVVLERNPHYWKADRDGRRLPFLEEIVIVFIPTEDAQAIRFRSGELHVINRISAENFLTLRDGAASGQFRLIDAGASLEYNFLVFNLDDTVESENATSGRRKTWFRQLNFRRAVSAAIDRQSIVRLVYRGLGDPLWGHVTEGSPMWLNRGLQKGARSLIEAHSLLKQSAFS
jgi:peptide/nickel transport system substrate-binding protein